ncbi:HPP family protein [Pimelobacter simplex]|uniref:CBS domain-containing protein n=1 Tax=Nocardioides simplex TaxID=2045 RepID=UPI003AACC08D
MATHVRDLMTASPITVRPGEPLRAAADLLAAHRVTALPVVDERGRVVGVLSEADLLGPGSGSGSGSRDLAGTVGEAMSSVVVLVHPETDVATLRRVLVDRLVKSLPVVDAADQVVGVVSRSDVVRAMVHGRDGGAGAR